MNQAELTAQPVTSASSWQARLELEYEHRPLRTVLSHRKHYGPLLVQKPFYPEGEICHSYLIHPPGGIVGGDRLELEIQVKENAQALITTPAANKFYRSAGRDAVLWQRIRVAEQASMEWLPQESILFDGSQVDMTTRIELCAQSHFVGWEMICLGRPASGDDYQSGRCFQKLEVFVDDKPRLLERVIYESDNIAFRQQPWGLSENQVTASMLVYPADQALLQDARDFISHDLKEAFPIEATLLEDMLVIRGMSPDASSLRDALMALWVALRPRVTGNPASWPRIWNT